MPSGLYKTVKRFLESVKTLGIARLIAIAGVGLTVLVIIAAVAMHGGGQPMAPLYSELELRKK